MRRTLARADAEAIRAEIDAKRGFPRTHAEEELTRIGGGIHVATVRTETAVAIEGDGAEVTITIVDTDEKHVEATRRVQLRAAKESPQDLRTPQLIAESIDAPADKIVSRS